MARRVMNKHGDYRWKGWDASRSPSATPPPIYGTSSAFSDSDPTPAMAVEAEPDRLFATREQLQALRALRRTHRLRPAGEPGRKDLLALTYAEAAAEIEELT